MTELEQHPTGWHKHVPGDLAHALETQGFQTAGLYVQIAAVPSLDIIAIGVWQDTKGNTVLQITNDAETSSQLFYAGASPDPGSQLAYLLERFGAAPSPLANNPSGEPGE